MYPIDPLQKSMLLSSNVLNRPPAQKVYFFIKCDDNDDDVAHDGDLYNGDYGDS